MRVTTNMVMRNYQNNLNSTAGGLEISRKQVETQRRFSSSYEDPSSAARAAVLERRYARNADYQNNVENTMKWQDCQEDAVMQLGKITTTIAEDYSLKALTDTASDVGRDTYAQALREMQKSMVQILNSRYGDSFVMGGNGGTEEAPFELSEDGKTLLYRGVDVNDPANAEALEQLSKETSYVDLGFGLSYDQDGELVSSSAFDCALPGINVVGFGKTEEGTSRNLILLAGQMAEVLEAEEFDREAYEKLWDQFKEGASEVQDTSTELGTKTQLLNTTMSKLENESISIQEQYNSQIGIDPAEAIMNYSWAMYSYNSALKIGTSIIGPSLLDFIK
ncbi:hypothetical protein H8S37_10630 [Mediterraneibacter sp. NSJ-55]|uniref:Flagellin N-terminal domain-containing protein n=1 Tax=Mediterraneibacter hominis TaxID=2763054 RepID=A0A923RSI9_9FIRM|nr:hypothetical protein [Mediterraneibacter hominis]MBC5689372.1 hypothetical protein [Mediterraneibacter hominis]